MINFPVIHWKRPDAHTWTLRSMAADVRWSKIAYARPPKNIFAAIAYSEDTLTLAVTARSQDGVTWTNGTAPIGQWEGILWAQELGLFVAVANDAFDTDTVCTSSDGITYVSRVGYAGTWNALGWNGTTVLAIEGGVGASAMSSTNGLDWTIHANALQSVGDGWYAVKWFAAGGVWVATNGTLIATSPDGVTWTQRYDSAAVFQILSFSTNDNVMVGLSASSDSYVTSPDGITWTLRTMGLGFAGYWSAVEWNGTLFCAVAQTSTGDYCATSATGTSGWAARPNAPAQQWNSLAWSAHLEMFAALSINGANRIMTSSTGS